MRVTFPRLPDHQRAYALIERDDGVVYRLEGGMAGPRLPHDIRHLVVERELGITDGIWAGIAAGAAVDGTRTELIANLVENVAALDHPSAGQIRRLASATLATLPDAGDAGLDPAAIAAAAVALQVEASRWARLRVGEELRYDWPRPPRAARTGPWPGPRLVRLPEEWKRRGTRG